MKEWERGGGRLSEVFKDKNFTGAMLNVLLYGRHIEFIITMGALLNASLYGHHVQTRTLSIKETLP